VCVHVCTCCWQKTGSSSRCLFWAFSALRSPIVFRSCSYLPVMSMTSWHHHTTAIHVAVRGQLWQMIGICVWQTLLTIEDLLLLLLLVVVMIILTVCTLAVTLLPCLINKRHCHIPRWHCLQQQFHPPLACQELDILVSRKTTASSLVWPVDRTHPVHQVRLVSPADLHRSRLRHRLFPRTTTCRLRFTPTPPVSTSTRVHMAESVSQQLTKTSKSMNKWCMIYLCLYCIDCWLGNGRAPSLHMHPRLCKKQLYS